MLKQQGIVCFLCVFLLIKLVNYKNKGDFIIYALISELKT